MSDDFSGGEEWELVVVWWFSALVKGALILVALSGFAAARYWWGS